MRIEGSQVRRYCNCELLKCFKHAHNTLNTPKKYAPRDMPIFPKMTSTSPNTDPFHHRLVEIWNLFEVHDLATRPDKIDTT